MPITSPPKYYRLVIDILTSERYDYTNNNRLVIKASTICVWGIRTNEIYCSGSFEKEPAVLGMQSIWGRCEKCRGDSRIARCGTPTPRKAFNPKNQKDGTKPSFHLISILPCFSSYSSIALRIRIRI